MWRGGGGDVPHSGNKHSWTSAPANDVSDRLTLVGGYGFIQIFELSAVTLLSC